MITMYQMEKKKYYKKYYMKQVCMHISQVLVTIRKYCKSGNIRGTLIFAYFVQIQQARIQKPAKIFAVPK